MKLFDWSSDLTCVKIAWHVSQICHPNSHIPECEPRALPNIYVGAFLGEMVNCFQSLISFTKKLHLRCSSRLLSDQDYEILTKFCFYTCAIKIRVLKNVATVSISLSVFFGLLKLVMVSGS